MTSLALKLLKMTEVGATKFGRQPSRLRLNDWQQDSAATETSTTPAKRLLIKLSSSVNKMYRNRKLLDLVRESPCQICGAQDGTVVAAHSNQQKDGKGMGLKAHDYRIAALCFSCHANIDQGKSLNKEARKEIWDEAHRRTIGWLFEGGHLTVR